MSRVFLGYKRDAEYPTDVFSGCDYPEYPFGDAKGGRNDVYSLVRDSLNGFGLDKDHFGTTLWNPFGEYIHSGDTVLIKPNFVMDKNENKIVKKNSLECLVTHPSLIKVVCDYCVIALSGSGRIIIADAPMQGCSFDRLISVLKLDEMINHYTSHGIDIELRDLRQYESVFNKNKVIVDRKDTGEEGVIVNLGSKSIHRTKGNQDYQVSDYDKLDTQKFHHGNHHSYEVSKTMLESDVVINLPKPKTHRLAGITASMKNMVGITYNKASLPHRTAGSVVEGGDAYNKKSFLKKISDRALVVKIRSEKNNRYRVATMCRYVYGVTLIIGRKLSRDPSYIGGWYGNDTIWRTIVDLNYIVNYADKDGNLCDEPQRKILNIGDMIVAGQGNGPVSPDPKELGVILISDDAYAFDKTVCRVMGFDDERIPMLRGINHMVADVKEKKIELMSNKAKMNGTLDKVSFPECWKFRPHDSWMGHV